MNNLEKINFKYENNGEAVAEFDSESDKFKELINIAILQLQNIINLKGHIYNSTLAPSIKENFQGDMNTLMACDLTIRTLKSIIELPKE